MIWSYSGIELRTLFTCVIAEMPDHPAGRLSIVRLRQCDHCNREYAPSPQCLHDRWRITGTRVDGSERRNGRNSLSVKRLNQKSRVITTLETASAPSSNPCLPANPTFSRKSLVILAIFGPQTAT